MLSPIVPENSSGSWSTMLICARSDSSVRSRTSWPSSRTRPLLRVVEARDQADSVLLPAPVGPTIATRVPGRRVEARRLAACRGGRA